MLSMVCVGLVVRSVTEATVECLRTWRLDSIEPRF